MAMVTIAGSMVDIKVSRTPGGWKAVGRLFEGVLPGAEAVEATDPSRKLAESHCKSMLEQLIHVRNCGAE